MARGIRGRKDVLDNSLQKKNYASAEISGTSFVNRKMDTTLLSTSIEKTLTSSMRH